LAVVLLLVMCPALAIGQTPGAPKPVVVRLDKSVDFSTFHTYSYKPSHAAMVKEVDARIVAAIEAQLRALGLTPAAPGAAADVTVTYHSVMRTDADLSTFDEVQPASGAQRKPTETYRVGTLAVDVIPSGKTAPAWRAKADGVLKGSTEAQIKVIDDTVAALFGVYPTKTGKK
jgi:hypothetical protein